MVTLSNGPQVLTGPGSAGRLQKELWRYGPVLSRQANQIAGRREKELPSSTLAPELQEFAERNQVFLHGFGENIGNGHWNATGHRVAGRVNCEKNLRRQPSQIARRA